MAKTVSSDVQPDTLQPDTITDGRLRLLVRWDATQTEIAEDDGTVRTGWMYQEQVINIPLFDPGYIDESGPRPVLSPAGLEYLIANEAEIVGWAQAGMTEATEAPGLKKRTAELEDAIAELSVLLAGGGA